MILDMIVPGKSVLALTTEAVLLDDRNHETSCSAQSVKKNNMCVCEALSCGVSSTCFPLARRRRPLDTERTPLLLTQQHAPLFPLPKSPPRGIVGRRGGQRWWCWWDEGSGRELRFLSRGWSPGYFLFCAGPVARALPVERSRRGVSTVAAPGKPAILKCYKVAVSPQVSQHAGAPASPSASPGSPSTSPAQRRPATGKNETRSPAVASFTPSPGGYLHY